jgi:hypothetical protein
LEERKERWEFVQNLSDDDIPKKLRVKKKKKKQTK